LGFDEQKDKTMEKLLGFKVNGPLWETFAKADKLAINLGAQDIPAEFELEDGVLSVMVPKDRIYEAREAMQ